MSLINDALKRAGQKPVASPSASETAAGMRPAEEEERPQGFPVLALFIVLIPLISVGVWFLVKGLQMKEPPPEGSSPPPAVAHARALPEPPLAPATVKSPPASAPASPQAPTYKLQGLYWRPSRPSAVVNGKTVYVGDRIDASARVAAIDKESVTLMVAGQAKLLLLP